VAASTSSEKIAQSCNIQYEKLKLDKKIWIIAKKELESYC
jgi:hypothetical protein